jgi:hypothetical protein
MSEKTLSTIPKPHFVISTEDGAIHGEETADNQEIVRRIHACVTACEGLSTEELERGIIQDMQRVLAEVVPVLQDRVPSQQQTQPARSIAVENRAFT